MSKHNNTISALNNAAPYIKLYKDKIFIIKIGGELLRDISSARKLLKQEHEKYTDKQLEEFIEWLEVLAKIEVELILKSKG